MGLLSKAWNVVDPFLPDEQVTGLLGRLGGGRPASQQDVTGYRPPQAAPQAPMRQGPGIGRYIEGFVQGRLPGQVNDQFRAKQGAQKLHEIIDQTVSDPRERMVAHLNPMEWAKQNATRYGYHGVSGGDQALFGDPSAGGSVHTAPKFGVDDGRGYSLGPGGMTSLGELAPSYADETARKNADANAAGYTLGAGGRRYDNQNNLVAEAPFAPRLEQVDPEKDLYQIGGPQGGQTTAPRISAPQALAQLFPKATVTSAARTPADQERLKREGKTPATNSYHLRGQALDLKPPAGMSTADFAQAIKDSGIPLQELIDEGDHVHVAWADGGPAAPDGPQLLRKGNPQAKPGWRPATPQEKASVGIPQDVPAQISPEGKVEPISGGAAGLKQVPPKIASGYTGNVAAMKQIDQAIAAIRANPGSVGFLRMAPDAINQRVDKPGIAARAQLTNIGSLKMHERSGAAVTAAETPRLLPFIPQVSDTPDAAIKKLEQLKHQYQGENDAMEVAYSDGYRPLNKAEAAPAAGLPPEGVTVTQGGKRYRNQGGKMVEVR